MLFLKKNIFNQLGFTVALFSVFFLLQSQTALAFGTCSGTCGVPGNCPSGTSDDPLNSTDCIIPPTLMCCRSTAGISSCSSQNGSCSSSSSCTGAGIEGSPLSAYGCSTAAAPYCCTKKASSTTDGDCSILGGICKSTCDTSASESSVGVCTASGIKCCKSAGAPGASASIPFTNPIGFTTVEGLFGGLMGALQGIIVVLSLVFIVIGAVLYITSAGDDGRMKTAKGAITASMIGLAIGIAAPSFLKQIYSILNADVCKNLTGAELTTCQASIATITGSGTRTLTEIALSVLQFLLSIVGILGIIMLVIGGIMYLTAAGDEHRIDSGKEIVKYAIIGITVALAALVIVTQIAALFV